MNLSFKEWLIEEKHELPKPKNAPKRKLPVHTNMKQWVSSVENLEKELETLKSILNTKKIDVVDDKHKDLAKKIDKHKDLAKKIDKHKDLAKKIDVVDDKHKDLAKKIDKHKDLAKKIDVTKNKKPNETPKVNPYSLIKGKENDKQIEKEQKPVKEKRLNGNVRKLS